MYSPRVVLSVELPVLLNEKFQNAYSNKRVLGILTRHFRWNKMHLVRIISKENVRLMYIFLAVCCTISIVWSLGLT